MRAMLALLCGLLLVCCAAGCGGAAGGGGGGGPDTTNGVDSSDPNTLDLGNGVTLALVEVPAGSFTMGSPQDEVGRLPNEGPQRTVELTTFRMAETPVTVAQWCRFLDDSRYEWTRDDDLAAAAPGDDYPAVYVTHEDAEAFCDWLSQRTGCAVRLPTEAQWEYACRAGTSTRFSYGDTESHDQMNFEGTGGADQFEQSSPVCTFPPNAWGLYDVHGGVLEHCRDRYVPEHYATRPDPDVDPEGPASGDQHVLRGGGWYSEAYLCRSAARGGDVSFFQGGRFGFRVVTEGQ